MPDLSKSTSKAVPMNQDLEDSILKQDGKGLKEGEEKELVQGQIAILKMRQEKRLLELTLDDMDAFAEAQEALKGKETELAKREAMTEADHNKNLKDAEVNEKVKRNLIAKLKGFQELDKKRAFQYKHASDALQTLCSKVFNSSMILPKCEWQSSVLPLVSQLLEDNLRLQQRIPDDEGLLTNELSDIEEKVTKLNEMATLPSNWGDTIRPYLSSIGLSDEQINSLKTVKPMNDWVDEVAELLEKLLVAHGSSLCFDKETGEFIPEDERPSLVTVPAT